VNHIVVDIETNGPYPPKYSMVSIGAVHHENPSDTFYRELRPISPFYTDIAYQVNGFTHEQVQGFGDVIEAMEDFDRWVREIKGNDRRIVFVSDTTSFDFAFVNYYLHTYTGENVFGHAPLSIHNVYKGITGNYRAGIGHLRKTRHDHTALQDAKGNQEAFAAVDKMMKERRNGHNNS
jgi:DNA polymerase III epsilon subunit-like protein